LWDKKLDERWALSVIRNKPQYVVPAISCSNTFLFDVSYREPN